jgi:hypothetical protein
MGNVLYSRQVPAHADTSLNPQTVRPRRAPPTAGACLADVAVMRRIAFALFVCFVEACGGLSASSGETADGGPAPSDDGGFPADSGPVIDGGSPCNTDQDCVGGSCVYLTSCPGTCLAYRTRGESCGSPVQGGSTCTVNGVPTPCEPLWGDCTPGSGLACDPIAHQCLPIPPVVIADAGEPCSIFGATCNTGLYCAGIFPDNGTCEPFVQDGGSCGIGTQCAAGLVCAGYGTSADAGVCRPPAPVGGSCLTPTGGNMGNSGCQSSLVCVQGQCEQPPATGPCVNGACQEDVAFCDKTIGTCQPLWANGTPCSQPVVAYSIQCQSHTCDLTGHCGTTICPSK